MFSNNPNNAPRIFAGISKGKFIIAKRDANGNPVLNADGKREYDTFDTLSGVITAISSHIAPASNGQPEVEYLDINIQDGDERACISVDVKGSVAETIILALASAKSINGRKAEFKVWAKDTGKGDGKVFTNVSIRLDGEKLGWAVAPEDRPKVEFIEGMVDPKTKLARINFVKSYLEKVKALMSTEVVNPETTTEALPAGVDDLPM